MHRTRIRLCGRCRASSRPAATEVAAAAVALVYVNTLMLQDILADDDWADALTPEDRRGLTPLFWTHIAPHGEVKLDMTSRLALGRPSSPGTPDHQRV